MKNSLPLLLAALLLAATPHTALAGTHAKATLNIYVLTRQQPSLSSLGPQGLHVAWDSGRNGFIHMNTHLYLTLKGDSRDVKAALETTGHIVYVRPGRSGETQVAVNAYPCENLTLKTRGQTFRVVEATVYRMYAKTGEAALTQSGDTVTVTFTLDYDALTAAFPTASFISLLVSWNQTLEPTAVTAPGGADLLDNPNATMQWRYTGLLLSLKGLERSGYTLNGPWTIAARRAGKPFYAGHGKGLVHATLSLDMKAERTLTLSPGETATINLLDITGPPPRGWRLLSPFFVYASGDTDNIRLTGVSYQTRFYGLHFTPHTDTFKATNTGSHTATLTLSILYTIQRPLELKLAHGGDPSSLKAYISVPGPADLPSGATYIGLSVSNKGHFKTLRLYAPNGTPAEELIDVEDERQTVHLYTSYSTLGAYVSLGPGKAGLTGIWTYTAKAPAIAVTGYGATLSKQPLATLQRGTARIAYYSIGDKVAVSLTSTTLTPGNRTRLTFKEWRGSGKGSYTGRDTSFTLDARPGLIAEKAVWEKEYLITIRTAPGKKAEEKWLPQGTTLEARVDRETVQIDENQRYRFKGWTGTVSATQNPLHLTVNGPANITASWALQYRVSAIDPYGTPTGAGWYDKGSVATISTSPLAAGFPVRHVFTHWLVNGKEMHGQTIRVTVNGPIAATAVRREDYTPLYAIAAAAVAATLGTLLWALRRRRKRTGF